MERTALRPSRTAAGLMETLRREAMNSVVGSLAVVASRADSPRKFVASGSAAVSSRRRAISGRPKKAAAWRGVAPSRLGRRGSAP